MARPPFLLGGALSYWRIELSSPRMSKHDKTRTTGEILLARVRAEDPAALEELYGLLSRGVRLLFLRRVPPQDADDLFHDTFLEVLRAIRQDKVREPSKLPGFVRTVALRRAARYFAARSRERENQDPSGVEEVLARNADSPETHVLEHDRRRVALQALSDLPRNYRQLVVRFYFLGQKERQICRDMNLSETQFRVTKSRAKARFLSRLEKRSVQRYEKQKIRRNA